MILTDAGPLVSMLDRSDPDREACERALASLRGPMLTTWAVLAEAMHLLRRGGWRAQRALFAKVESGDLEIVEMPAGSLARARALMERYADVPMSLPDATLVAIAEARGLRTILTLDADFRVYRLHGRTAFEIIPS